MKCLDFFIINHYTISLFVAKQTESLSTVCDIKLYNRSLIPFLGKQLVHEV